MKASHTILSFLLTLICLSYSLAQSESECERKSLFSKMPNHKETNCVVQEFDKHTFLKSVNNGNNYESLIKEGEKTTVSYNWMGEWEKRPSPTQIYKNYQSAIERQGGELLYAGSSVYFKLKKSADTYYIEIQTDGSGLYIITTIKEKDMRQDVVYTEKDIARSINQDGQITFYGIYFDHNKATIKSESAGSLKEIAGYLKTNGKHVYMVGHTDNSGSHEYNLQLSKDRAKAVVNELINNYGVPSNQLSYEGVGELCPITNNFSEEGKAKNRRVVMVLK